MQFQEEPCSVFADSRSPPYPLPFWLNLPRSLLFSSYTMCSSLNWLQIVNVFHVLQRPKVDITTQLWSHNCRGERNNHLIILANAAWHAVGLPCCNDALLVCVQLDVHQDCQVLPAKLLSCQSSVCPVHGLISHQGRAWCFPWLNFMRFTLAHFSGLISSILTAFLLWHCLKSCREHPFPLPGPLYRHYTILVLVGTSEVLYKEVAALCTSDS